MDTHFLSNGQDIINLFITDKTVIDRLANNATLWGFGSNSLGALGLGATSSVSALTIIDNQTKWRSISCGNQFFAAIDTQDNLWVSGKNDVGQLGLNDVSAFKNTLTKVSIAAWSEIECGYNSIIGIKNDGTLWGAGKNSSNELGIVNPGNKLSFTQISSDSWKQVSVGSASYPSLGVRTNGTLYGWGTGPIGNNTNSDYETPTLIETGSLTNKLFKSTAVSEYQCLALEETGRLWLWGNMPLALSETEANVVINPVQVDEYSYKRATCNAGVVAAIREDGTLWLLGKNDVGQLGLGFVSDVTTDFLQTAVMGNNWHSIIISPIGSIFAIKTDNSLWVWGNNSNGLLGKDPVTYPFITTPVQLPGINNWKQLAVSENSLLGITFNNLLI